jgi:hypothetical protein
VLSAASVKLVPPPLRPTIVAAFQGTPPIVAIAVLPTPVGSGGRPDSLVMSKAPPVTTRVAGTAPPRASAV